MKNSLRILGIGMIAAAAFALAAQDAWTLKRNAKVGETARYKLVANVELPGMGGATVDGFVEEKVVTVDESGTFVIESQQKGTKITMEGQGEQAMPDEPPTKTKFNAEGAVLEITSDSPNAANSYRISNLGAFRYPANAVKVGDEWSVDIAKDEKTGVEPAKMTFKVESSETVGSWSTVKVKVTAKESEGDTPATADGFVWIDIPTGIIVKSETNWINAPLPGAPFPINAKITVTRES